MEELDVDKGIIYYTDNRLGDSIALVVRDYIKKAELPIVSVSLKPIDFGKNIVLEGVNRSYPTMVKQIVMGLEASTADIVFFCEHDVLYHKGHFDFTPERDDIFYYNINNWRWKYWDNRLIQYDGLSSLSMLCVYRKLALDHFKMRLEKIREMGLDADRSREPRWARKWGYEPGTKKKKRGGFTDDDFETWRSEYPNVDIRHKKTFSHPKCDLKDFKHKPTGWLERTFDQIEEWDLKELFNL